MLSWWIGWGGGIKAQESEVQFSLNSASREIHKIIFRPILRDRNYFKINNKTCPVEPLASNTDSNWLLIGWQPNELLSDNYMTIYEDFLGTHGTE